MEVSRIDSSLSRITIEERLPIDWMGPFTSGLSALGINIEAGQASRDDRGHWFAEIDINAGPRIDVTGLTYERIMEFGRKAAKRSGKLSLNLYTVEKSDRFGGSLRVQVRADDSIGFLATLLDSFVMYSQFAYEVSISTQGGYIDDCFFLKGFGGSTPPDSVRIAISDMLASHVAKRQALSAGSR